MVELVVRETLLWKGRLGKGKPYCGYQVSVYFIQTTKNLQWSKLGDQKFWQFAVKKNGGNLQPQPFRRPQCEQSREPTGEDPMHRTHPWPSERCSWEKRVQPGTATRTLRNAGFTSLKQTSQQIKHLRFTKVKFWHPNIQGSSFDTKIGHSRGWKFHGSSPLALIAVLTFSIRVSKEKEHPGKAGWLWFL